VSATILFVVVMLAFCWFCVGVYAAVMNISLSLIHLYWLRKVPL